MKLEMRVWTYCKFRFLVLYLNIAKQCQSARSPMHPMHRNMFGARSCKSAATSMMPMLHFNYIISLWLSPFWLWSSMHVCWKRQQWTKHLLQPANPNTHHVTPFETSDHNSSIVNSSRSQTVACGVVWSVACGVWSVECRVWSVVCGV